MKNYLTKFVYMLWLVLFPGLAFSALNARYTEASLFTSTWNPLGDTISPKIKSGLKKFGSAVPKKPELILNLNANEGSAASPGVSGDLRIIPNIGVQFKIGNLGLGLDAGMFSSSPDFNYDTYYQQIDSLGFIYEHSNDKWKSRYITLGPQYTLHFSPKPKSTGARSFSTALSSGSAGSAGMDLTFSLKFGVTKNKPPDISIYDSVAPFTIIASYQAPDGYKQNAFSIKPAVAFIYWFNDRFGANVSMQYMIVTGQDEFTTGYRDLSHINWDLQQREIRYQVMKAPVTASTTTSGPGNMFSIGAGVNVKFGLKEKPHGDIPMQPEVPSQPGAAKPGTTALNSGNKPADQKTVNEPVTKSNKQDPEKEKEKEYIRPSILSPANGSTVTAAELEKGVLLQWTAVAPPPPGQVFYHVKLFEVADGQQADQATRSNKAVFEKNVTNLTQTSFSKSKSVNAQGKQPQYTWTVQATDPGGKPYGSNNGMSEVSTFMVGDNDIDIAIDSLNVECCKDGKQLIKFTIKNNLPNTNTVLKKIIITAVNGNFGMPYPMDISAMVSPPLPYSFLPSSTSLSQGRMNFTASVDCNINMNNLVLKAEAERNTNMGLVTDNDLETDTLNCICHECDKIKITIPEKAETSYAPGSITLNTPVSVSPKKVKKVTADIIYYSYIPKSDDCAPCDKDSKTFGNFISASLNAPGFPANGAVPYGHEATWSSNSNSGALLNGQFSINISAPPLVKCCSAKFRFCIRYTFQFEDCTVCEKVVCYTINKEGCNK